MNRGILPLHLPNSLNTMRRTWESSSGGMQKKKKKKYGGDWMSSLGREKCVGGV